MDRSGNNEVYIGLAFLIIDHQKLLYNTHKIHKYLTCLDIKYTFYAVNCLIK